MSRFIPKSDGVEQRFSDFSTRLDRSYAALTTGIKGNALGFEIAVAGEYIPRDHAHPQSNFAQDFDPKHGQMRPPVPVPHPRYEERDDLKPHAGIRPPRPY